MIYLGIDPGKLGGVVALDIEGNALVAHTTPLDDSGDYNLREMFGILEDLTVGFGNDEPTAGLEVLRPFSGGGVKDGREKARRAAPKTIFEMGRGRGLWQMALAACGIPCMDVEPKAWRRSMILPIGSRKESKPEITRLALLRWPQLCYEIGDRSESGVADAACIADYVRRECAITERQRL